MSVYFHTSSFLCFVQMMEGYMDASCGSIVIEGHSVRSGMEGMSGLVGVCPQHDLLWESLTGREHLLFYARLHALKVHHRQLVSLTAVHCTQPYHHHCASSDEMPAQVSP